MDGFYRIKELLAERGIDTVGAVKLCDCKILREYKIKNAGLDTNTPLFVYIFAVPYYTKHDGESNISKYAAPRDYHLYFNSLFNEIITLLEKENPEYNFAGFTDNSPIDEIHAAAVAGLGIIGKNGLLLTEKYSSFVFLGEIITDMPTDNCQAHEIRECINCGKCISACPKSEIGECLSSLTQRKGALKDSEIDAIKKHGSAWGCDICQSVCPYTEAAINNGTIYTQIDFFCNKLTPLLYTDTVNGMSDKDFSERAYSWRKRETILRNLEILEK